MKSILVHVREDEGQQSRIDAAIAVARATGGRLTCLQVVPTTESYPPHPLVSSHLVKALRDSLVELRASEAANRGRLEAELKNQGVDHEWADYCDGDTLAAIARASRFSDLAVVSLGTTVRTAFDPMPLLEELILSASVPILAVPPALHGFDLAGPAVVAWNGSQEAAAACRAAVPLLQLASRVIVVTVGEDDDLVSSAEELRCYLHQHYIEAVIRAEMGEDTSAALQRAASEEGAAWLVAGAFGHARWRETIFGGVTKALLADDARPLLMAR